MVVFAVPTVPMLLPTAPGRMIAPDAASVLPEEPIAVQRIHACRIHWRPVSEPVPRVSAPVVVSVVPSVPETPHARKTVRLEVVPPVLMVPEASTLRVMPGYHWVPLNCVGRMKSCGPAACGLMVAVEAEADSAVPAVVCHGTPALSRFSQV